MPYLRLIPFIHGYLREVGCTGYVVSPYRCPGATSLIQPRTGDAPPAKFGAFVQPIVFSDPTLLTLCFVKSETFTCVAERLTSRVHERAALR